MATTTTNPVTQSPIQLMDWQGELAKGNTDAQTRTVQDDERVEHQLNRLTTSNSQYIQNARRTAAEQASDRGMLFSSVAAGASQRAAVDAALPIAQADAATYGRTASENMAATNADRLADQQMHGNLLGQAVGIRANLDDAERGRAFTSSENAAQRAWQGGQNAAQLAHASSENALGRAHDIARQNQQEAWQSFENDLQRNFQGDESSKQYQQQRFLQFDNGMQNYNNQLMQTLSSIYSNPNLTASQQAAAASNARATHESLYRSYAATMSAGVPEIYWDPYPYQGGGAYPGGGNVTIPGTLPGTNLGPAAPPPTPLNPPPQSPRVGGGGSGTSDASGGRFQRDLNHNPGVQVQ